MEYLHQRWMVKCAWVGGLVVRDLRRLTTAMLSDPKWIFLQDHRGPHTAAEITIGTSSFVVIWIACQSSGHRSWNQPWGWANAPQPNIPEASENTSVETSVTGKSEVPFQSCKKVHHHIRSALAPALRRRWWCALFSERSWKSCRRKTRPCGITATVWDRWPRSDSNSCLVHVCRGTYCCIICWSRVRFSQLKIVSVDKDP